MKPFALSISVLLLSALTAAPRADEDPTVFKVTQQVINSDLQALTATVDSLGNRASPRVGSAFEPVQWRDKIMVTEDHPHAVIASEADISAHDRLREGFLDGAEVMVFRVVGGEMKLVRRDRVAEGGHKASGWQPALGNNKLIAPSQTRFEVGFDDWNRKGTDYWFALTAVSTDGAESPPSPAVKYFRPADAGKTGAAKGIITHKSGDGRRAPPSPEDLRVEENPENGNPILHWPEVKHRKLAGYRLLRSDYAPAQHAGFRLELQSSAADAEPLRTGDMVLLHKTIDYPSRKQLLSNRVYGSGHRRDIQIAGGPSFFPDEDPAISWRLEPHPADTPVENPGQTAIRFDLNGEQQHRFDKYAFGDTEQPSRWWPVLNPDKEYVVEVWLRQQEMDNPKVQFSVEGPYRGEMKPITFEAGETWAKHSASFKVPRLLDSLGPVGKVALTFSGPGTLWMDNYRVYEKGTPYLALLPEDEQAIRESGVTALRSHQFIKTPRSTYSMEQLTNSAAVINAGKGNTLAQFLQILEKAELQPWLQIEFFMSPDEWRGFVEYMAAPYDPEQDTPESKPWAAKRYSQGRREPWVTAFDKIYFELSNETWNGLFAPWTFQGMPDAATGKKLDRGTVYGLFQEWVIEQLRSSPYWRPELDDKFEFVIGGWALQTDEHGYGARAIAASPSSEHMTIADYIGGWDEGEGPSATNQASFQRILTHAALKGTERSRDHAETRAELAEQGVRYQLGVYEGGPGYAMSGLNNQAKMSAEQVEEQARAMKSLAAGTATLDAVLTKAEHGFYINNFFTWSRRRNHWHSHATWYDGGQAYPSWKAVTLFNRFATGDLLRVHSESVDTIDMPAHRKRKAQSDVPLTAAYASRSGDRLSVFVISRKLDRPEQGDPGVTPVELQVPVKSADKLTLHRMTGAPRAHNLDEEIIGIESLVLPTELAGPTLAINAQTGGAAGGLPPASVLVYVYEGVEFTPPEEVEPGVLSRVLDSLRDFWR